MLYVNLTYGFVGRQVKNMKKLEIYLTADYKSYCVGRNECVSHCHVELRRDIWIMPKLAFRLQPDLSTRLRLGRDDKVFRRALCGRVAATE